MLARCIDSNNVLLFRTNTAKEAEAGAQEQERAEPEEHEPEEQEPEDC